MFPQPFYFIYYARDTMTEGFQRVFIRILMKRKAQKKQLFCFFSTVCTDPWCSIGPKYPKVYCSVKSNKVIMLKKVISKAISEGLKAKLPAPVQYVPIIELDSYIFTQKPRITITSFSGEFLFIFVFSCCCFLRYYNFLHCCCYKRPWAWFRYYT